MKKKIIVFFLAVVLCLTLCSCGSKLNGTYVSESGRFTIEFKTDGTCTWYQDGLYFHGTYDKTDEGWQLKIEGSGIYPNTMFTAVKDGKNLIVDGGIVNHKTFIKH